MTNANNRPSANSLDPPGLPADVAAVTAAPLEYSPPDAPSRANRHWFPAACSAALAITLYAHTLAGSFVYDDNCQAKNDERLKDVGQEPGDEQDDRGADQDAERLRGDRDDEGPQGEDDQPEDQARLAPRHDVGEGVRP